ncbi:Uncharacterised protein [Mycobacteroides abscessus subsp. bolletii]|nr:Uncharacterised protein [Mycobacteroides abscessus subsp. bolletii]
MGDTGDIPDPQIDVIGKPGVGADDQHIAAGRPAGRDGAPLPGRGHRIGLGDPGVEFERRQDQRAHGGELRRYRCAGAHPDLGRTAGATLGVVAEQATVTARTTTGHATGARVAGTPGSGGESIPERRQGLGADGFTVLPAAAAPGSLTACAARRRGHRCASGAGDRRGITSAAVIAEAQALVLPAQTAAPGEDRIRPRLDGEGAGGPRSGVAADTECARAAFTGTAATGGRGDHILPIPACRPRRGCPRRGAWTGEYGGFRGPERDRGVEPAHIGEDVLQRIDRRTLGIDRVDQRGHRRVSLLLGCPGHIVAAELVVQLGRDRSQRLGQSFDRLTGHARGVADRVDTGIDRALNAGLRGTGRR